MAEEEKAVVESGHDTCHNPCEECQGTGYLQNGEVCPECGGTGCRDKKFCTPAGGLGCDKE